MLLLVLFVSRLGIRYIAAWTAFSLVTIGPLLHGAWWLWVVPISIGLPAIFATTAFYQRKFAPGPKAALT
ncbi:MAG TPA: hypothetical protein VIJ53_14995 [Acidobacteriaceae bacterium]|jgi:hypothetical protein